MNGIATTMINVIITSYGLTNHHASRTLHIQSLVLCKNRFFKLFSSKYLNKLLSTYHLINKGL